jgi:hypothetical protein
MIRPRSAHPSHERSRLQSSAARATLSCDTATATSAAAKYTSRRGGRSRSWF